METFLRCFSIFVISTCDNKILSDHSRLFSSFVGPEQCVVNSCVCESGEQVRGNNLRHSTSHPATTCCPLPVTHHHYIIKATSHCLPFPAFLFVQCLQPAIKQSKYLQKVQLNLLLIICFVFLHNTDHDLLDTETLLCSSIKRVVRALRLRYSSDLLTEFFVFFI